MKILAIDTSTKYLSIAVMKDERVVARFHRCAAMRHSRLLIPTVKRLLARARLKLPMIDLFCISAGPGSFTGLRIGVTAVKALTFACKKPAVAVPTLDVIAYNARTRPGIIVPILDARKQKVYAAIYCSDGASIKRLSRHLLLPAGDVMAMLRRFKDEAVTFLGDGIPKEGVDGAIVADWYPCAMSVGLLGAELFRKRKTVTAQRLEPLYLYSKECDITGW